MTVGIRERFEHAVDDLDARAELRRRHCGTRPCDVDLHGIDADACRIMCPDKSNQVRRVAAPGVEDRRSRRQVLGGEIVQRVRPARLKASIQ